MRGGPLVPGKINNALIKLKIYQRTSHKLFIKKICIKAVAKKASKLQHKTVIDFQLENVGEN